MCAVTRTGAAARKHPATLARWRSAPAAPRAITDDERDLLDAIARARQTNDYTPLDRWGGGVEAARAAARLDARPRPRNTATAAIDSYLTHVAAGLASNTLGL